MTRITATTSAVALAAAAAIDDLATHHTSVEFLRQTIASSSHVLRGSDDGMSRESSHGDDAMNDMLNMSAAAWPQTTEATADLEFVWPDDMQYTVTNTISIVLYSILFIFAFIGNIKVLTVLIKKRLRSPSRIDAMLMHLAIADLFVTLVLVPTEIGIAATVQWYAGDFMCRVMAFSKVFGIYLSSYVMICISLDRYYAILKPLKISGIDSRTRIMLASAWVGAAVCSAPQLYLFQLKAHPQVEHYHQCMAITAETFSYWYQMISWSLFYAMPLIVIIFCYVSIYCKIYRRTKKALSGNVTLRRTNIDVLGRAKRRTLKMTMVIVIVFIICWSPFNLMYLWHTFDKESAQSVSNLVQKVLFFFACTNSSMNPIVYGIFNTNRNKKKHEHIIVTQISSLSKRSDRSTCKSI